MDLPSSWSAERLLLVTGIPVLLIPDGWTGATIGDAPLIAWNRSREARRAVNDALPFINMAAKVTILTIDSDRNHGHYGDDSGTNLAEHLTRHGATVEVAKLSPDGTEIGSTNLSCPLINVQ